MAGVYTVGYSRKLLLNFHSQLIRPNLLAGTFFSVFNQFSMRWSRLVLNTLLLSALAAVWVHAMDDEPPPEPPPERRARVRIQALDTPPVPTRYTLPVWQLNPEFTPEIDLIDWRQHSVVPSNGRLITIPEAEPNEEQQRVLAPSGEGTSQGPPVLHYEIPVFSHQNRNWGPYKIGGSKFDTKAYPLKIRVLQELYKHKPVQSYDFENLQHPDGSPRAGSRLRTRGNMLYPDPQRLLEIGYALWDRLKENGRQPELVSPDQNLPLEQGHWLWPPIEVTVDGLQAPKETLYNFRRMLLRRSESHSQATPSLFRLKVPTREGGERYILMVPALANSHTAFRATPRSSTLWLFYEVLGHQERYKMALLGATYLPKDAVNILRATETIRPALIEHAHI